MILMIILFARRTILSYTGYFGDNDDIKSNEDNEIFVS